LSKYVKENGEYPNWNVAKKLPEKPTAKTNAAKPRPVRKSAPS
jgi:hypothetical protein